MHWHLHLVPEHEHVLRAKLGSLVVLILHVHRLENEDAPYTWGVGVVFSNVPSVLQYSSENRIGLVIRSPSACVASELTLLQSLHQTLRHSINPGTCYAVLQLLRLLLLSYTFSRFATSAQSPCFIFCLTIASRSQSKIAKAPIGPDTKVQSAIFGNSFLHNGAS